MPLSGTVSTVFARLGCRDGPCPFGEQVWESPHPAVQTAAAVVFLFLAWGGGGGEGRSSASLLLRGSIEKKENEKNVRPRTEKHCTPFSRLQVACTPKH